MNTLSSQTFGASGVIELTEGEFSEISSMIRDNCGINLTIAKLGLVNSRLQKRIRVLNLQNFSTYIHYLKSQNGVAEMEEMISAITTNVTSFNRESHHFVHFKENVLPKLIAKAKSGAAVRLWSAGCSDGREPYTLACSILEYFPDVDNYDFKILATDIDKYSIDMGRKGEYSKEFFNKMPNNEVEKWFKKSGKKLEADKNLKNIVHFNVLNLMALWPMKKNFDVIFCRNVLIYFTPADQAKILHNFTKRMNPKSYLYIGHSERVEGPAAKLLKSDGVTTYSLISDSDGGEL